MRPSNYLAVLLAAIFPTWSLAANCEFYLRGATLEKPSDSLRREVAEFAGTSAKMNYALYSKLLLRSHLPIEGKGAVIGI